MKSEDFTLIQQRLRLEEEATSVEERNTNIYYLKGIDSASGKDINYLVCCYDKNNVFNLKNYLDSEKDLSGETYYGVIFVFDDLDQETNQFYEEYDSIKSSRQKNYLVNIFDKKVSVFREKKKIDINVDKEINYLEYSTHSELNGYIFNVSFLELKKLFVVCGPNLFRQNVRFGVSDETAERNKLVSSFGKYIKVGFYNEFINKFKLEDETSKQSLLGELDLLENDIKTTLLEGFWFKHNGVTLFVEDKQLVAVGPRIRLDSKKISVINGAQTMTNLYKLLYQTKHNLNLIFGEKEFSFIKKEFNTKKEYEQFLDGIIETVCRAIYIKTVFVVGNIEHVSGISDGLNTQLPITEMDLLATYEDTEKINELMRSSYIRIIRSGEYEDDWNISVLDFAKYIKVIEGMPGTSKNLNKNEIEKLLAQIASDNDSTWVSKMETVINADIWWRNNRRDKRIHAIDDIEDKVCRYGRNYILSFFARYDGFEDFENGYVDFLSTVRESQIDKSLDAFRKDELFKDIIKIYNKKLRDNNTTTHAVKVKAIEIALKKKLQGIQASQAASIIKEVYNEQGTILADCRTVKVDEYNMPTEAFPFSNKSFMELCNLNNGKYPEFDDSLFKLDIEKKRFLIVLSIKDNSISEVKLLSGISFFDYEEDAKRVYEQTIDAFNSGDEQSFPRMSDGMSFHVRPHATNSEDTFMFTNGKEITKRSFWVNREIIKDIIDKNEESE